MTFDIPVTVDIPDGNWPATLEKVETDKGQFGDFRRWSFLVEFTDKEDAKKIEVLSVLTSANTGPQSKSYQWLTALLGSAPQAGTKVESPNGSRCVLTVGHNDKGFPTVVAVGPYQDPQQTLPGIPR